MNINQAVYTTKYIVNFNKPILYVVHDEDGEWQFLGGQEITMDDMMIVSLKNILELDESINDILDLGRNMEAQRINKNGSWTKTLIDN